MIYSAVSLLFSLTANGFWFSRDFVRALFILIINLTGLAIVLLYIWPLNFQNEAEEWKYVGADNLMKKIIILLFSVSTRPPLYLCLGNYIHPELSFNFILDPGLIVVGLMVVLLPR